MKNFAEQIKKLLNFELNISYYDSLESTNKTAKEKAKVDNCDGVVFAKGQTNGRGRMDRSFYSPKNSGIYMSIYLHPNISVNKLTNLTALASVAVIKAIKKLYKNLSPKIKWINDIYIENKKICGILTESSFNINKTFVVVGIGINLFKADNIPEDIKDIMGFIEDGKVNETKVVKLSAEILNEFFDLYYNKKDYFTDYYNHSLVLGKEITVISKDKSYIAKAIDIDKDFHLIVEHNNKKETLFSGEISIRLE